MILALETSTPEGSLALMDVSTGAVLLESRFHSDRNHNTALFGPLEDMLNHAPAPPSLLVVGTGPGSYGGVRTGISAALGLAMSYRCPALGLPSIATLAPDALVVGDARRASFFAVRVQNHELQGPPDIHQESAFRDLVENSTLPVLTMDSQAPLGLVERIELRLPSAARLALLAWQMSDVRRSAQVQRPLEPLYVRPPFITQAKKRFPVAP